MSQLNPFRIELEGKVYHITGDDLTIVVGKNLKLNISREVPQSVRDSIAKRYNARIARLEKEYKAGARSLAEQDKAMAQARADHETAAAEAARLAVIFSTVNFEEEAFRFRLAYVIYKQGEVDGALALLNDKDLEANETCQAMNYLIKAAANWQKGDTAQTLLVMAQVSKKYPSLTVWTSRGDYQQLAGDYGEAAKSYATAIGFTDQQVERYYLHSQMAFCHLVGGNLGEMDEALRQMGKAVPDWTALHPVANACHFPAPIFPAMHEWVDARANLLLAYQLQTANHPTAIAHLQNANAFYDKSPLATNAEHTLYLYCIGKSSHDLGTVPPLGLLQRIHDHVYQAGASRLPAAIQSEIAAWLCHSLVAAGGHHEAMRVVGQLLPTREQAYKSSTESGAWQYAEALGWKYQAAKGLGDREAAKLVWKQLKALKQKHGNMPAIQALYDQLKLIE